MSEFPAIIRGGGDLAAFLKTNKPVVDAALDDTGALLFRGVDVPDPQAFDAAIEGYGEPGFTYEDSLSNAVRTNVTPRVFTANEAPPSTEIFLHHEMAQTPIYPSKLFFYCEIAEMTGGATPLCRSDWVMDRLVEHAPEFVARLAAEGVRYTNVMPGADDAGSGEDGSLKVTTAALPAVRDVGGGRKTFFNQLIAAFRGWSDSRNSADKSITFGGGEPISAKDMAPAIAAADELTVNCEWQPGDVALVDNYTVMHGRRPYEGKRRVLASLVA